MLHKRFTALLVVAMLVIQMVALALPGPAMAGGGDFTVKFAAADSYTYNHYTGGGAWDDGTINQDIVYQLEGAQFKCGDIVTFLFKIEVKRKAVGSQTIAFTFDFSANTTGQNGVGLIDILNEGNNPVKINYGIVQGGDGVGGTDSAIVDDGDSTATLVYEEIINGPVYQGTALVRGTVVVDDLEAEEVVVVRVDTVIGCDPGTDPTGNVQEKLVSACTIAGMGSWSTCLDTINTGTQTVNFQQMGDIGGTGEPNIKVIKTVTTPDGTCPENGVIEPDKLTFYYTGSTFPVKYCYQVTNTGTHTLYDISGTDNGWDPDFTGYTHVVNNWTGFLDLDDNLTDPDGTDEPNDLPATDPDTYAYGYHTGVVVPADLGLYKNVITATGDDDKAIPTTYSSTDPAYVEVIEYPEAVTIAGVSATPGLGGVLLQWETGSEISNLGFNLYRSRTGDIADAVKLNSELIPSQAFGSIVGASYAFTDETAKPGVAYTYWLEDVEAINSGIIGPDLAHLTAMGVGSWNMPKAVKVFPFEGSVLALSGQRFGAFFQDKDGDLAYGYLLINGTPELKGGLAVRYEVGSGLMSMYDQRIGQWLPGLAPGVADSLGCPFGALRAYGSSVEFRDVGIIAARFQLKFWARFVGEHRIWLMAEDIAGNTTGWQPYGPWAVLAAP